MTIKDGRYKYDDREIITNFANPPIPIRSMDWNAVFYDYDDDDDRIGRGATEVEAVIDLIENWG